MSVACRVGVWLSRSGSTIAAVTSRDNIVVESPHDDHVLTPTAADSEDAVVPPFSMAAAGERAPASSADVGRAYLDQALIGYLVYGVGAVTAFLAVTLSLSDAQAGLHSSALASGMVVAGLISDRLDRLAGTKHVHFAGLTLLTVASLLLVWAPAFAVTLVGAGLVGFGVGLVLAHINQTLSAGGGSLARVRIARSTLIAMIASLSVPLSIGLGVSSGLGWQVVVVPALVLVGLALWVTRDRGERAAPSTSGSGRLPPAYWPAWLLAGLFIAIEFAIVFWASTLVAGQTGVSLADATLVISAFIFGVVIGRVGLSLHAVSARDPIVVLRFGIALLFAGSLACWASTSFELSLLGFLIGGLGLALLFPIGAALALATAPMQSHLASGRLVLATGLAILAAPLVLGVVADLTSVVVAWLLVPTMCLVAMALTVPVSRGRGAYG